MSRLKWRADKLATRNPVGPDRIGTVIRTIVEPGYLDREPNMFLCQFGGMTIMNEPGEPLDFYVARVRAVAGDRIVRIVAKFV